MKNQEEKAICPIILTGEVVHGKGLGRTVGMPTANLRVEGDMLPEAGVYATRVKIAGKSYGSVTNIGLRPSVDEDRHVTVESYIMDFREDIYGKQIELEIVKFLRPIRKFQNLEEVSKQVKKDVEEAKIMLDISLLA